MAQVDAPTGVDIAPRQKLWGGYLVLPENRSAVRAAQRLLQSLAKPLARCPFACPLVLHGPTGTGKTALLQSLVKQILEMPEARTVRQLPSSELPRASQDPDRELEDLMDVDLLILEDLHHIKTPDAETLGLLLDRRSVFQRPTILTAPTGPANLGNLPRRLTNRLSAGLVLGMNSPDTPSRIELARHYAEVRSIHLTPASLTWLADNAHGVRPLFGLIEKLRPLAKRTVGALTVEQIEPVLGDSAPPAKPAMQRIVESVCETYHVKARELCGASRLRAVLLPRHVAMYLAREVAKVPLVKIGQHFGGRDHSTVLHAVRKIALAMQEDRKLAATIRELRGGVGH